MWCISLERCTSISFFYLTAGSMVDFPLAPWQQISLFFLLFSQLKIMFLAIYHYWIVALLKGKRFYFMSFILLIAFQPGLELLLTSSSAFSLLEQLFWRHNINFLVLKFSFLPLHSLLLLKGSFFSAW